MKILHVEHEPDPWPRATAVSPGSAFAAVAGAVLVQPERARAEPVGPVAPRDETALRTWRFKKAEPGTGPGMAAGPEAGPGGDDWRLVAVPHTWARAEPELADWKGPVVYERDVALEQDGRYQLRFAGLDYVASVHADGRLLGAHEGGFTPVAFDLEPVPRTAGGTPVRITVEVDDPVEEGMIGPNPLVAAKRKVKGVFEFHDSRPGGQIPGLHWTGAFARRWGTGGMVEPATLVRTGDVRLDAVFAHAGEDQLAVSWVLTSFAAEPVRVSLRTLLTDPLGEEAGIVVEAIVPPGHARVAIRSTVADAVAWQPVGTPGTVGACYLGATEVEVGGATSDTGTFRFGFRSLDLRLTPEEPFQMHLNGRRTYVRAGNYIPGVWMPELAEQTFRQDLALAAGANLNSLGPHAHVLPERFYDAADEAGMLVYQDFPLNLAHDPAGPPLFEGGPTMAEASLLLAAEMTYALFNHPSVVYYCGHNEPAYQLGEAFQGSDHPDIVAMRDAFLSAPDEEPLDDARVRLWNQIDPTRSALKASGLGRHREVGDVHTYTGSLSTDPTTAVAGTVTPFLSEFGAWTANFSAAARAVGAAGDWPPDRAAEADWEHRTHLWFSNVLRAGRPERYPGFASWTYASQLWAGAFIKVGTEGMRSRKWAPSAAHRYHLFVDHWGDAGAGVVDRHRTRQLSYWALRAANRPVLPIVETPERMRLEPGTTASLRAWVVNDLHEELGPVRLRWSLRRLAPGEAFVIGVDDPQVVHPFGEPKPTPGDLVVVPRAEGAEGAQVASGEQRIEVGTDASVPITPVTFEVPRDDVPTAYCLRLLLGTPQGEIPNWVAFVAAPSEWEAPPGLSGAQAQVSLTVKGSGPYRLVHRWTGATVSAGSVDGQAVLADLVPGQYLVVTSDGSVPVDLYGDVALDLAAGAVYALTALPWEFSP